MLHGERERKEGMKFQLFANQSLLPSPLHPQRGFKGCFYFWHTKYNYFWTCLSHSLSLAVSKGCRKLSSSSLQEGRNVRVRHAECAASASQALLKALLLLLFFFLFWLDSGSAESLQAGRETSLTLSSTGVKKIIQFSFGNFNILGLKWGPK